MNTQLTKPTEPNIAPFKNHENGKFKSQKDMYEYLALYEKYQEDLAKYNNALKEQEQNELWHELVMLMGRREVPMVEIKSKFTITRK